LESLSSYLLSWDGAAPRAEICSARNVPKTSALIDGYAADSHCAAYKNANLRSLHSAIE